MHFDLISTLMLSYVFWPNFRPQTMHYVFWPNFHPNAIHYVACRRISGCRYTPPKSNVCEPEPQNEFRDVTAFVFSLANQTL